MSQPTDKLNRHPLWSDRCKKEATRDVIFILFRLSYELVGTPCGYHYNHDEEYKLLNDDTHESVENKDVFGTETIDGYPAVIQRKYPVHIFLSREEAEKWASDRTYNYSDGYEVYGMPCEGELITALNSGYWKLELDQQRRLEDDEPA